MRDESNPLELHKPHLPFLVFLCVASALGGLLWGFDAIVSSDTFNLSSLLRMVTAGQLKAAGVQAAEKPVLLIEDFQEGWEKEWFVKGQKSRKTFKLRSPQYHAPPNSKLGIEVQSDKKGRMLLGMDMEKNSYRHSIMIEGDSQWQQVVLSPSDFKNRDGETPDDWDDLDIVISLPAGWEWEDLKMRNLMWVKAPNGNQ